MLKGIQHTSKMVLGGADICTYNTFATRRRGNFRQKSVIVINVIISLRGDEENVSILHKWITMIGSICIIRFSRSEYMRLGLSALVWVCVCVSEEIETMTQQNVDSV